MSNLNEDMENAVIADLERQIETLEYERSKSDIQSYLSVTQSLEGLLGNEKTVKHIKDFLLFFVELKIHKSITSRKWTRHSLPTKASRLCVCLAVNTGRTGNGIRSNYYVASPRL